jgi:hypothetical protein
MSMTWQQIQEATARISVFDRSRAMPFRCQVWQEPGSDLIFFRSYWSISMPDAERHEPAQGLWTSVQPQNDFAVLSIDNLDELLDLVRRSIRTLVHHEIDHWLSLDGVLVRDPHPELRKRKEIP